MKVLNIGKVCLDVINYMDGYPVEDSDQSIMFQRWAQGGNAANMCVVTDQLRSVFCKEKGDVQIELFGSFGSDLASTYIRHLLQDTYNVDLQRCPIVSTKNGNGLLSTSCVVVNRKNGSRTIVHGKNDVRDVAYEHLVKANLNFQEYDWIHFETREVEETKRMLDLVLSWKQDSGSRKPLVSVELEHNKPGSDVLLSGADYIFISKDFARGRNCTNMQEAVTYVSRLVNCPEVTIVCPWGDEGACVMDSNQPFACPSYHSDQAIDTLGAGDTFFSSFIFAKCHFRRSSNDALKFACLVAGIKCSIIGYDQLSDKLNTIIQEKGSDYFWSWC